MKIQELAIIFIIIILPISLILSEFTQFEIKTINLQTAYDAKLRDATYDAIKAFQLNTINSSHSDIADSKMRDLEASVNTFRNSIMVGFELNGYTDEALNNYIPALIYTLYDGFYIYSPYRNTHDESGNVLSSSEQKSIYGLKPYISYSCRYKYPSNSANPTIDVIITYTLDNYITVQGILDENGDGIGEYVNKSGYLIEDIELDGNNVIYNDIVIEKEQLKENVGGTILDYAKINGTKYYLFEDYSEGKDCIIYFSNGKPSIQCKEGNPQFIAYKDMILNNNNAVQYYRDAYKFTKWFKSTDLDELKYSDAVDEIISDDGVISTDKVWPDDDRVIFEFDARTNINIENDVSEFNQHRLEVIRHKIETNLAVAIANYNDYSRADNVFQMPNLKEDEWAQITHNISLISFLQGLPIGGKVYNGYSIVTNSESEEVVHEEYIYMLGDDGNYHKIGDQGLEDGSIVLNAGNYVGDSNVNGNLSDDQKASAGRLNLDFERKLLVNNNNTMSAYYYPLKDYDASYDSVVMQNNVTTYDDIYEYVNSRNDDFKKAFYTALGRERYSSFKSSNTAREYYSVLIAGKATEQYADLYGRITSTIFEDMSEDKEIKATYVFNNNEQELMEYVSNQKNNYNLIILSSYVWSINLNSRIVEDVSNATNLITIGNDIYNLKVMEGGIPASIGSSTVTPNITDIGINRFGDIRISPKSDTQAAFRFKRDVNNDGIDDFEVFYKGTYTGAIQGEYDLIGCWQNENHRWIHSQVSLQDEEHMKLLKELVKYALKID